MFVGGGGGGPLFFFLGLDGFYTNFVRNMVCNYKRFRFSLLLGKPINDQTQAQICFIQDKEAGSTWQVIPLIINFFGQAGVR